MSARAAGRSPEAEAPASPLLAPFRHFVRKSADRPFIVAQLGQSLDGRIATPTGDSRYIGSAPSLDHLHRIRAHVDAVVVGIGTVLADDPQLNVRRCPGPNPARVVIDAGGRLQPEARCLDDSDGARRIVLRRKHISAPPLPPGIEIVTPEARPDGRFDMAEIGRALARLGFGKVLIEGGASIVGQAIDAGIVDRLHIMVSPVIIGSGKAGLELAPIRLLAEARRPVTEVTVLGEGEVLFDCALAS